MTVEEAKKEMMKFVRLKTTQLPTFADVLMEAELVGRGKWIKVDDDEPIAYDCSECDSMVTRMYNYCPKCGAKMDKEEQA